MKYLSILVICTFYSAILSCNENKETSVKSVGRDMRWNEIKEDSPKNLRIFEAIAPMGTGFHSVAILHRSLQDQIADSKVLATRNDIKQDGKITAFFRTDYATIGQVKLAIEVSELRIERTALKNLDTSLVLLERSNLLKILDGLNRGKLDDQSRFISAI